jgi:hypothetical protein
MIVRFFRWLLEQPKKYPPSPPPPPPDPTPIPTTPSYQAPTGREIRKLLQNKAEIFSSILQLHVNVHKRRYEFIYVFTHSAWYTIAFTYNEMKLPSLTCFARGKKTDEEMAELIKAELLRKKKAKLLKELRQKRGV